MTRFGQVAYIQKQISDVKKKTTKSKFKKSEVAISESTKMNATTVKKVPRVKIIRKVNPSATATQPNSLTVTPEKRQNVRTVVS